MEYPIDNKNKIKNNKNLLLNDKKCVKFQKENKQERCF